MNSAVTSANNAQGARGVQVTDYLVGPSQQVPGHVADPSGGVDQVGSPTERGDLRQDSVDGGLQGELQRVEVSCRGEGPGVLEGEDLRVVPVQAGVPEGQRGVHRGLLDEREQRCCNELTHVGGRGPESHSGGEVAGAGHGQRRLDPELRLRCVHHAADRRRHQHRAPRLLHPNRGNCHRGGGQADYSTTVQMNQAITDALVPFETAVQRDAAIAAALGAFYTSAQTDAGALQHHGPDEPGHRRRVGALRDGGPAGRRNRGSPRGFLRFHSNGRRNHGGAGALYGTAAERDSAIAAALASVTLSNGQSWNGGPTFKLRERRALQLRHQQLGDLGHQLGFVELRQQQPGR